MAQVETVKVQREKSDANPTGVVIINKEDFDEKVDKLYVEEESAPPQQQQATPDAKSTKKVDAKADAKTVAAAPADAKADATADASTDGEKKPWDK